MLSPSLYSEAESIDLVGSPETARFPEVLTDEEVSDILTKSENPGCFAMGSHLLVEGIKGFFPSYPSEPSPTLVVKIIKEGLSRIPLVAENIPEFIEGLHYKHIIDETGAKVCMLFSHLEELLRKKHLLPDEVHEILNGFYNNYYFSEDENPIDPEFKFTDPVIGLLSDINMILNSTCDVQVTDIRILRNRIVTEVGPSLLINNYIFYCIRKARAKAVETNKLEKSEPDLILTF